MWEPPLGLQNGEQLGNSPQIGGSGGAIDPHFNFSGIPETTAIAVYHGFTQGDRFFVGDILWHCMGNEPRKGRNLPGSLHWAHSLGRFRGQIEEGLPVGQLQAKGLG